MRVSSTNKVRAVGLTLCLLSFVREDKPVRAEAPMSADEAIALLEPFERRINTIQYHVDVKQMQCSEVNKPQTATPDPALVGHFQRGDITYEPATGRYRVDLDSAAKWFQGEADTVATRNYLSFDGRSERRWLQGFPGLKLLPIDDPKPTTGEIDHEERDRFMKQWGFGSGLALFPPNCYGVRLSQLIREREKGKEPIRIFKVSDDQIRLEIPHPHLNPSCTAIVYFDIVRGCPVQIEDASGTPLTPYVRWYIDSMDAGSGIWVPKREDRVILLGKTSLSRATFTNVKINEPVDESVFRVSFPPGTRVTDKIEKKFYMVGKGAADEQLEVRKFTKEQELALSGSNADLGRPWWHWAGIVVGFLLLAAFITYAGWRWRKRNSAVAMGIIILLLLGEFGGHAAELDSEGNWAVSHAKGESIRISQCGLNVVIFAFEHFGNTQYDLKQTVKALPPDERGIRLADMRDVLEAHGFEAIARKGVKAAELRSAVKPGTIAILPIKVSETVNHYFVLVCCPRRGLLVVDAPATAVPFNDEWYGKHHNDFDGLVVFVRQRGDSGSHQADEVHCEPRLCDFGSYNLAAPNSSEWITKSIVLRNPTAHPMMISEIQSSCGCLTAGWKGGLLPAGASQTLELTMMPQRWGVGKVTRIVRLLFADGSTLTLQVASELIRPEVAAQVAVSPNLLRIEAPLSGVEVPLVREISVTLGDAKVEDVKYSSSAAWLRPSLVQTGEHKATLRLEIEPPEALSRSFELTGEVSLAAREGVPPVTLQVIFYHPFRHTVDPPILDIQAKNSATLTLKPISNPGGQFTRIVVLSAPDNLEIGFDKQMDQATILRIQVPADLPPGPHPVKCMAYFKTENGVTVTPSPIQFTIRRSP